MEARKLGTIAQRLDPPQHQPYKLTRTKNIVLLTAAAERKGTYQRGACEHEVHDRRRDAAAEPLLPAIEHNDAAQKGKPLRLKSLQQNLKPTSPYQASA